MTGPAPLNDEAAVRAAIAEAGSIAGAARLLGVSRKTVYAYLRRYSIDLEPPTRKLAA
jgi:transcriptional regulator of acetoin/glycerol metabolism